MNATHAYVPRNTFPAMGWLRFIFISGAALALMVYGAFGWVFWSDGGMLICLGLLFFSFVVLAGIACGFERQNGRLMAVVRGCPKYPMILLDKSGQAACLSESVADLTGVTASDLVSKDPWETLFDRDEKTVRFAARIHSLVKAGDRGGLSGEVTAKGAGGRALPVSVTYVPLGLDHKGGVLHVCDLNRSDQAEREIAEYHRVESALLKLIHELFVPEAPGRRLIGATLSVSSLAGEHASGDFFECIPWNGYVYDVIVGDVMGGGLAAALIGLETKGGLLQAVTNLMAQGGNGGLPEVSRVVGEASRFIAHKLALRESFITLCYARFDFEERQLSWVDCGHAPIIHWQVSTRRAVLLKGPNTPIGFETDESYQSCRVRFDPDDLFVICSDGVIETRSPTGEMFGVERLVATVEGASDLPIHEVGRTIRKCLTDYVQGGKQTKDEQTIVCVRVLETKSKRCLRTWRFDFLVQLSALNQFRQHVRAVYADTDVLKSVSPGEAELMLLALHEVLVNIIGHSGRETSDAALSIRLEASLFDDRMEWTFAHCMPFFSPTRIHTPSDDGSQSDGYGLFIIEKIADRVRYYRNERGESCVSLIKWFLPFLAGGSTGEAST